MYLAPSNSFSLFSSSLTSCLLLYDTNKTFKAIVLLLHSNFLQSLECEGNYVFPITIINKWFKFRNSFWMMINIFMV